MAFPIPGHTCNFYCWGNQHAVPSIKAVSATAEQAEKSFAFCAALWGYKVISYRPCEANAVEWGASHGLHVDLLQHDKPFIAIVEPITEVEE